MPKLLKTPFAIDAAEGFRTDIQESTGAAPNSATYQVGFPPVTMQSIASNGMPPKGSDLNGVLYDITDNLVFLTQGGGYGFDAAYATSIGGYPINARLRLANGDIVKSTIDGNTNDPNVDITGWVLSHNEKLRIFNVLDYGADPTGETSSYLAFKKCSEALSEAGSGEYVVPFGTYICGFQETPPIGGEDFRRIGRYPINLQELDNVVLDLQGCILKNPDGMYYGNFNADMTPSGAEARWLPSYRCSTGALINLVANKSVEIKGSAKLDGNLANFTIGGVYGDFGIQTESYGLRLLANKSLVNNGAIEVTDFGNDGVYVADKYRNKSGAWVESSDLTELARHTVKGIRSTYNARQGISFCGGSGAIEDCYIEGIGKTRLTTTLPRAGIDVEQEAGVLRDLTINRTTIFDCAGISLVTTSGDSKRILVKDSRLVGISNYSNYSFSGVYENTLFVGKVGTGGTPETLAVRGDYPTYNGCTFSSRTVDARGLTPFGGGLLVEQIFQDVREFATFDDCDFYTTGGWCYLEGLTEFTFKNCRFYVAPETSRSGLLTQFGRSNLINCEFIDLRDNPSADITITRSNTNSGAWENVKISSNTGRLKFLWVAANDSSGILSNNKPSQILPSVQLVRDGNQVVVDLNKTKLASIYVRSNLPTSVTNFGNPYGIGDRILNGLPTATSWVDAVCTVDGYSCNTSWAANTAYTVNTYVYANSKVYRCSVAGTSGTVAPSHGSGTATDGTVTWEILGRLAVFRQNGVAALSASVAYDPPSLAVNERSPIQTLTLTGAVMGDNINVSFNRTLNGVSLVAYVSAVDTAAFYFENRTSAVVDLPSGTVKVKVV